MTRARLDSASCERGHSETQRGLSAVQRLAKLSELYARSREQELRGESRGWRCPPIGGLVVLEMAEDLGDRSGIEDEGDNPHLRTAGAA